MKQRQRRRWLAKTERTTRIGKRCSEYDDGCVVCRCWKFYDEHGRFPEFHEVPVPLFPLLEYPL